MTDHAPLQSVAASRRYELERVAAAVALAEAATDRLRTILPPGVSDAVASMLRSDLEQADQRVEWLRQRLNERPEVEGAA